MNTHCEFSSRFHSDSKRIRSGFESKRRESPRIHNVFAQQYGFANFGRVFTVIHCETLSWVILMFRNISHSMVSINTGCFDPMATPLAMQLSTQTNSVPHLANWFDSLVGTGTRCSQ